MKYSARQGAISKLSPARKLRAVFRNHNMFDEYEWYLHAVTNQGASHTRRKSGGKGICAKFFAIQSASLLCGWGSFATLM